MMSDAKDSGSEHTMGAKSHQFLKNVYSWLFFAISLSVVTALMTHYLDLLPPEPERSKVLGYIGSIRTAAILLGMTAARMGRAKIVGSLYILSSVGAGVSMGSLFTFATTESMASIFVMTLALFGAFSVFGYTSSRDLSPLAWLYSFSFFFFLIFWKVFPIPVPELIDIAVAFGLLINLLILSYETQKTRACAHSSYLSAKRGESMALFQSFTLFIAFQITFAGVFFLLFVPRSGSPS